MKKKRTASLKQNLLVLIKNEECSFREQAKKNYQGENLYKLIFFIRKLN